MTSTETVLDEPGAPLPSKPMPSEPLYILDTSRQLASNQIHRIARDRDCRLWLAGPVGLARFDGSFVRDWNRHSGLHCNGLRSVAIGRDDEVWIGTDLGFERLNTAGQPLPGVAPGTWKFGLCQSIDATGSHPWIGTANGLVKLERLNGAAGYGVDFGADIGFVNEVRCLADDRVLAASAAAGLVETDGKTWWTYRCEDLIGRQITRVAIAISGELLVGTDDGLYVVDDSTRKLIARLRAARSDPLVTAIGTAADRYWIAFGRSLVAYSLNTPGLPAIERYDLDSPVNDLLTDDYGNVFIATNCSGLAMLSCLRHAVQKIDIGLAGGVYSIKPGGDDSYTIGGEHILEKLAPPLEAAEEPITISFVAAEPRSSHTLVKTPQSFQAWRGLPETIVWDSLEDENGMWVATQAGLFRAASSGEFTQCFSQDPILGAPGRVLMKRGEEMWAGTLRGLSCIRNGDATSVDLDGAPLGYVYALHLDDESALWIGTLGRGLWREKWGFEAIVVGPLTEDGNTYAVAQGPAGAMIVLQDEKVVLLDRDLRPRLVAEIPPVSGWAVAWMDMGTIAIGASDGLRVLDLDSGRVIRHVQSLFKLPQWEFTNNRTLVRDRQGRFLCGLNGGLMRVDLERFKSFTPPTCKLTEVFWNHAEPEYEGEVAQLRPGRWSFRVRAFSAWFVEFDKIRYQFKLIGFDDTWSPLQDRPEVAFTSLPPGTYSLVCQAYSPLTGFGPTAELLRLEVKRPLWAIGWSALLATFESSYDQQVRSRKRNETLLEENRALELYVDASINSLRIANQQLESSRDAYKTLAEIDELTRLGNRRNFEKELGRSMALSTRLNVPLALLMIDIDHFKMVNDHYGHGIGDDYLRAVGKVLASAIRLGEDVAARIGGEEFAILLLNTDTEGALLSADRIRARVEELVLVNTNAPRKKLTVSVGVAALTPQTPMSREEFVTRADRALYRAKGNGRNCVSP